MKTVLAIALVLGFPVNAQTPQLYGALTYSGGLWSPALSSGSALPTSLTPQTIGLMCYNSGLGKWVAADSSCFGGGGSAPGGTSTNEQYRLNSTTLGGTTTIYIAPSGDATGATDNAAIQAACNTGGVVRLAATPSTIFYITGVSMTTTPCTIKGAGNKQTSAQMESGTNYAFTVSYSDAAAPGNTGGSISDFELHQDPGVTPTAGGAFFVGLTGATYPGHQTSGFHLDNVNVTGTFGGIRTRWAYLSFFDNDIFTLMGGGSGNDGCIRLDTPNPNGDLYFNSVACSGANSGLIIDQSDRNEFISFKTNGGGGSPANNKSGIQFNDPSLETQDSTRNITFVDPSIEGSGANGCAINYDTSSFGGPSNVQVIGGEFSFGPTTVLCNNGTPISYYQMADAFGLHQQPITLSNIYDGTIYPPGQSPTSGIYSMNLWVPDIGTSWAGDCSVAGTFPCFGGTGVSPYWLTMRNSSNFNGGSATGLDLGLVVDDYQGYLPGHSWLTTETYDFGAYHASEVILAPTDPTGCGGTGGVGCAFPSFHFRPTSYSGSFAGKRGWAWFNGGLSVGFDAESQIDPGAGAIYTQGVSEHGKFNAATNPLPTCDSGSASYYLGGTAVVSDATAPIYMGAYSSGGGVTAEVICSYNGATYGWLTH